MKLKHRLIISFCIIIFLPVLISAILHFGLEDYYARADMIDYAVSAILILIFTAVILFIWLYGGIMPKINELKKAAGKIESGDLDSPIDIRGKDELSELGRSMERMRKRLKSDTVQKIETENAERQLISNIAHDLKTPLTSIKGYSEGLLDGIANTPEKQQKYLKTIYSKANEMNDLLNELSAYSKIETDRIPYEFEKVNLKDFCLTCSEDVGMDLANQGIGLSFYNYTADDTLIIADPKQLKRVIDNIIGNAVKYRRADTPLSISMRVRDVGDFIQVEIEDNGMGIAKEDLPYIFDRSFRADRSRNTGKPGSGIGLAIVKKIINDHGGQIWATSKLNEGTVFYFVIRKYVEKA